MCIGHRFLLLKRLYKEQTNMNHAVETLAMLRAKLDKLEQSVKQSTPRDDSPKDDVDTLMAKALHDCLCALETPLQPGASGVLKNIDALQKRVYCMEQRVNAYMKRVENQGKCM